MPKFKFKDGIIIEASTVEEAKSLHKIKADIEDDADDARKCIWRIEDAINHIKTEVDNSIKALDVVKKDSFSKDVVKEYVNEIKKYVDETDFKENIDELQSIINKMGRTKSWNEWKEKCLAILPDCSAGEAQQIEEALEELCH